MVEAPFQATRTSCAKAAVIYSTTFLLAEFCFKAKKIAASASFYMKQCFLQEPTQAAIFLR